MVTLEGILGRNYKAMQLPAFLWALPITIISFLLLFAGTTIGLLLGVKSGTEGTLNILPFIGGILVSALFTSIIYGLFLYLGLRNISKKFPMDKYDIRLNFCANITIYVILIQTIVFSIIEQKFTFSGVGLFPLILLFIIPAIYKPKSQQIISSQN